jgi:hypothetical protein
MIREILRALKALDTPREPAVRLAQAQDAAEAAVRWLSRDLACPANEHVINDACAVARRTVERYWGSGHDPVELGVQAGEMYVKRNGVKV